MMSGALREYNWRDIERLIFADAGLTTDEQSRTRGEFWCVGGFNHPEFELNTCVRVHVYDKPFSERIIDHSGH